MGDPMRVLILAFLLFTNHVHSLPCEEPITISYGPFVTLLVVQKYFGEFHKRLEESSGCMVRYKIQRDFDQFLMALFRREDTLAVVPGPYFNVLKRMGYLAVSTQVRVEPRVSYIVSKKGKGISRLNDLVGRKVLVSSHLASSGSFFVQALTDEGLLEHVMVDYEHAYDSMLFAVLRNEADAAVLIEEYWLSLDEHIRNNNLSLVAEIKSDASTEFVMLKERHNIAPMVLDALQASEMRWGPPATKAIGSPLLETLLLNKLEQFNKAQD
ncbi:MAG: ABC-type phosphate/phosphonate transport system substrate-binding protein [Bermanella sp.]|jgi:ABC-type phosphate/phosphonate transport system substrate-binding protein